MVSATDLCGRLESRRALDVELDPEGGAITDHEVGLRLRVLRRGTVLAAAIMPLMGRRLDPASSDKLLGLLTALYSSLAGALPPSWHGGLPHAVREMATVVCTGLTQQVYRLALDLSNRESGGDGSDDESPAKRPAGARRRAKRILSAMPALVRAVESLETTLLRLAEAAGDSTILVQLRRSTSRDIQVDSARVADALGRTST